jgi:beta-glucosidase
MYLTMNQEDNRMKEDSVVDERTLHEIYLPPFEAAIHDGNVGTVMCAYVKTNGTYSCESSALLNGILRTQLKFDGWIMSDWGATHSAVAAANNGLDQEMPGDKFFGKPLREAVSDGHVTMDVLNSHVRAILIPMFRQGLFDKAQSGNWAANVRTTQHDSFSREVAEQGTILLKNEGDILPLVQPKTLAIIGAAGGTTPKVEGGGSSGVIAPYAVSPLAGIRKRAGAGVKVTYADGSDLRSTAKMARSADVAIVFVHTDETEGRDRPNLELPGNQDQLIAAVAAANKRTIVVLDTGGPVLMPWIDQVDGLLEAWYPGQEDGNAIAAILYGDVNPAAKLPLTFPRKANMIPVASPQQWPGVNGVSRYDEKLNVGYRWYDAMHREPLFPFGFGLSYTSFRLQHLTISPREVSVSSGARALVTIDVTNTGQRDGAEVVQAYVGQPASNGEPPRQLCGFARVELKPGETRQVTMTLDARAFSIYDTAAHRWISPEGRYRVMVGSSSRDLPLQGTIAVHAGTAQDTLR